MQHGFWNSFYFPEITTEAKGKITKTHEILAEEGAIIIDTVSYKNLTPGNTYLLRASLVDKKTGKVLRSGGRKVIAKHRFVPDDADGTERVRITFDASDLAGKTVVVAGLKSSTEDCVRQLFATTSYDALYACGSEHMMKAVTQMAKSAHVPCQVSLERAMLCGFGACGVCTVSTTNGPACCCTRGPVFDGKEVIW